MPTATAPNAARSASSTLDLGTTPVHRNLSVPQLIDLSIKRGEGVLAANGALMCDTGERTGRSPNDKFLEDSPGVHANIAWGKVNQPVTPEQFEGLRKLALDHLRGKSELFRFDGYAGADPAYRLKVSVITEEAWHSLFAKTLFINAPDAELASFAPDWTIINACNLKIADPAKYGVTNNLAIVQSLEKRTVVIIGTRYAGEIKKSIFYAMNYDLPAMGVFPMHCSANVDRNDPKNVALFFGLSGTGKTTLSADPKRDLVGDDEHGWSDRGVFNIEGGCYAKCIKLSREGEPEIWNAIRFGSVLENVTLNPKTREPDYDDGSKTENTRVTYPVSFIANARIPSVAGHPKNVIFLTADAYGVLPPVSKLSREQAQYYFINGYTSKLAGTEAGVTEPQPNFSACFGGPFMPREPMVYAELLEKRIADHQCDVWLLNTGWTGGPYGVGSRFKLAWTRALVTAILDGTLRNAKLETHPIFGLHMPTSAPGVPSEALNPRSTWKDTAAYDAKATELAKKFRDNDAKFKLSSAVPRGGTEGVMEAAAVAPNMINMPPPALDVTFSDIVEARERIRSGIFETPCTESQALSDLFGCHVHCKLEYLQRTGSFKERGARNALLQLPVEQRGIGVTAASAGNHALALAWHGRQLGIPVTVVMPRFAPLVKQVRCRQLGATVLIDGENIADAKERAEELVARDGLAYIHGFNDAAIIAGQGTIGLEILEQVPNADAVIVPVGGAGLIAGVALAIKTARPRVQIIGVEPVRAASYTQALACGKPVRAEMKPTLADGLAVPEVGARAFELARRHVDRVVLVGEEDISLAILRLVELEKGVVEGAGAASLAALLAHHRGELEGLRGKRVVLLLCGGNIDPMVLGRVIEHGLAVDGRLIQFTAVIRDRPGGLAELAALIAQSGGSIQQVTHERAFGGPDISTVQVLCTVGVRDRDHADELQRVLVDHGIRVLDRAVPRGE